MNFGAFVPARYAVLCPTIVFIDEAIDRYQEIAGAVQPGAEVCILAAHRDGIEQITKALSGKAIANVHIIAHGTPGSLRLGNTDLSLSTLERHAWSLQAWFAAVPSCIVPHLSLYGCNLAAGIEGQKLIGKLHDLTGAAIHAATKPVGQPALGGEWNLDVHYGGDSIDIALQTSLLKEYSGVFATATDGFYRYADSNEAGIDDPTANAWYKSDISTSGTLIRPVDNNGLPNSNGEVGISLPFVFNFYGTESQELTVSADGAIIFNTLDGDIRETNGRLGGSSHPGLAILPFWDDLDGIAGGIHHETITDSDGDRHFVIQWTEAPHEDLEGAPGTSGITFQVILHEDSNNIDFIYQDTNFDETEGSYNFGYNATIGLNKDNAVFLQYSNNGDPVNGTPTKSLDGISWIRFFAEPDIKVNALEISEGETVTLDETHILVTDVNSFDPDLLIKVSNVQNGYFEDKANPGTPITQFLQRKVAAGDIRFVHTGGATGELAPSYEISVDDGTNSIGPEAATITFTSINDKPDITGVPASQSFNENTVNSNPALLYPDVTLTDIDSPNFDGGSLTLTYTSGGSGEDRLSIRSEGAISFDGTSILHNSSLIGEVDPSQNGRDGGSLRINFNNRATLAAVEALIEKLIYQNTSNTPILNRTVRLTIADGDDETIFRDTAVSVIAENDAPVNTIPLSQSLEIDEDTVLTFSGDQLISISDVDAGANPVRVTLTAVNGVLTLATTAGLASATGNGTGNLTLNGSIAVINAALNGMTFTPTAQYNGSASVRVQTNDQSNSGNGGAKTDDETINITVKPVNDAPVNSVPLAQQTVAEDEVLTFSSGNGNLIQISDLDIGTNPAQVTLSVDNGMLSLSQTDGLTFTLGDGAEDAILEFSGTVDAINAALAGLTYQADQDYNGADTLTVLTSDLGAVGSGGPLTDRDEVDITVVAVNDDPINTVPTAQQVNEDTVLEFSTARGNALSIEDVDVAEGSGLAKVILSVENGTLSLAQTTGLTFTEGDGVDDTTVTFEGAIANINAALDGLTYKGDANYNGSDTLTLNTSDLGNFSASGTDILTDIDTVAIDVEAVNDIPALTNVRATVEFLEDDLNSAAAIIDGDVLVSDMDSPDFAGGQIVLRYVGGGSSQDQLYVRDEGFGAGQIGLNGTEVQFGGVAIATIDPVNTGADGKGLTLNLTGAGATPAAIRALIQNLTYGNTSETPASERTIAITVSDGDGGTSDAKTTLIRVQSQNDVPVLTKRQLTLEEGQTLTLSTDNLAATDVDNDDATLRFSVNSVQNGEFRVNGNPNNVFTQAQLEAGVVQFIHNGSENAPSFRVSVADNLTPTAFADATIAFTRVNDAPLLSGVETARVFNENDLNSAPVALDSTITFSDIDSPNFAGGNLTVRYVSGNSSDDQLAVLTAGDIEFSGIAVTYQGETIGLVDSTDDGKDGQNLVINFNDEATPAAVKALIENLSYQNVSEDPVGDRTLSITVNDGSTRNSTSSPVSIRVTVNSQNDAPVAGENKISLKEGDPITLSADNLTATDVDDEDGTLRFVVSNVQGGKFQVNEVDTVSFTQAQLLAGEVRFVHNGGEQAPSYEINITDGVNTTQAAEVFVEFEPVNDAPILGGLRSPINFSGTNISTTPQIIDSTLTLVDPDSPNFAGGQLTIGYTNSGGAAEDQLSVLNEGNGAGQIGFNGTDVSYGGQIIGSINGANNGQSGANLIIDLNEQATFVAVKALIEHVTYQNTSRTPIENRTIDITLSDGDGSTSAAIRTLINVTPENDPPEITAPQAITTNEDTAITFVEENLISIDDPDSGSESVKVFLTATRGVLTLSDTSNLLFFEGSDGVKDQRLVFSGAVVDVNAALDGMLFEPVDNFNGPASVAILVDDQGNTGDGGAKTDEDLIDITINAINDTPTLTVPGLQTVDEDVPLAFTGDRRVQVADPDAAGEPIKVSLAVNRGTLSLNRDVNGITWLTGDGEADSQVEFLGTVADVNAALMGLVYLGEKNFNDVDTLTITVNDQGNTGGDGPLTAEETVDINLIAVNDAPVNRVPDAQEVNEDTDLVFSLLNGNAITVSDADVNEDTGLVAVTFEVEQGTLTLAQTVGLDFSEGDGTADDTMTLSGTIVDINAALNGMTYRGDRNYDGADVLSITVNDQGNTGKPGARFDTDTVDIDLLPVNDAPRLVNNKRATVNEGRSLTLTAAMLRGTDPDDAGPGLTYSLDEAPTNGQLELSITPGKAITRFTQDDLDQGRVVYVHDGSETTGDRFTFTLADGREDGAAESEGTFAIQVRPVNDAPVISEGNALAQQMNEDGTPLTFTLTASDAEKNSLTWTVLTAARHGVAVVNASNSDTRKTVTYTPEADFNGPDSFTVQVRDSAGAVDTITVNVDVAAVNDAPTITGLPNTSVDEGRPYQFTPVVTDIDEGDVLTFSIENQPVWASFDPNSGTLSGVPGDADVGTTANIVIRVSDGTATTNLFPFNLTVIDDEIFGSAGSDQIEGKVGDDIISGLEDNDLLFGLDGNDIIYGNDGDDQLDGNNGNDTLYGDAGNDRLLGQAGDDTLYGNDGTDFLFGDIGKDAVFGGNGNDVLRGGDDIDELYGELDNDRLFGEKGNDLLVGGKGKDRLKGGLGNDTLLGSNGNDNLVGGRGNDLLDGGRGKDKLKGNVGKDVFVMNRKGFARINDYEDGFDKLAIFGVNGKRVFGKLDITQRGKRTFIEFGDRTIAQLQGVDADLITKADFTRV